MKLALKVSFTLNLVLAGILIFQLEARRKMPSVAAITPAAKPPAAEVAPTAVSAPPSAEAKPFRWSRLASSGDYRAYVANLRAIGCPEPTIHDIVMGDTDRTFARKRFELHIDGFETGPWSAQEELKLVAYLLGEPVVSSVSKEASRGQSLEQDADAPSYPLVFENVDLNTLGLNDGQKEAVEQLQQQFIEEIGGMNQDPSDPAYLARWRKAQPEIDMMLRGWIGGQNFMEYQIAAGNAANAQYGKSQ